jgi:hypothetical protein
MRWLKPRYQFAGALMFCSAAYYYNYKPTSANVKVIPPTLLIKEYCETDGMSASEITNFISLIDASCDYLRSDHPKRTIDQIIQQGGSLATIATLASSQYQSLLLMRRFDKIPTVVFGFIL